MLQTDSKSCLKWGLTICSWVKQRETYQTITTQKDILAVYAWLAGWTLSVPWKPQMGRNLYYRNPADKNTLLINKRVEHQCNVGKYAWVKPLKCWNFCLYDTNCKNPEGKLLCLEDAETRSPKRVVHRCKSIHMHKNIQFNVKQSTLFCLKLIGHAFSNLLIAQMHNAKKRT